MAHDVPDAVSPVPEVPADATGRQAPEHDPAARLDAVLDLALAVGAVAPADGVSAIVAAGAARRVRATSAGLEEIDRLQLDLCDGPALAAMSTLTLQPVELRPSAPRWPNYHRAALAHGMRRALCLPLVADDEALGALTLFRRDSGPFPDGVQRAAELVAARTARAITCTGARDAPPSSRPGDVIDPVRTGEPAPPGVPSDGPRDEVVTAAQGILRSRKQYSDEEAFASLREASERRRRPLPDVAREVVDLPEHMRPKGGSYSPDPGSPS